MSDFTTVAPDDHSYGETTVGGIIVICTNTFAIIASITTIILLTNWDVFPDRTKWPLMNYASASLVFAVFTIINFVGLRNVDLDTGVCSFVFILHDIFVVARGLALAFLVIDLTDWIRSRKEHDRRMQRRAYRITIVILWVVSIIIAILRQVPVWMDKEKCDHTHPDQIFKLLSYGLLIMCILLPILSGCFYTKHTGDQGKKDFPDHHTPKESLIVVCVLCIFYVLLGVGMLIPGIGHFLSAFQLIYDGVALLVCIFVFHQLRFVCCFFCRN